MSDMSASDFLSLANNIRDNDGIFGGNGSGIWFILILFFLCGNGAWGGNSATRSDIYEGLNSQNTFSEFRSLQNEVTNGFASTNQNLYRSFYDTALGMANGFANVNQNMCAGFNGVQAAIADTNYRMQNCCCDIKQKISEDGQATRNLIQQNEIQKLREELQDAKNENLATGLVTAQGIQTNNLKDFFRSMFNGGCGCGY